MARWLKSYWILLVIIGVTLAYAPLTGRTESTQEYQKKIDTLIDVIDLIQKQSIEPPITSSLTRTSIDGMLSTLDPHSHYMDEDEFRAMRDEQRGSFCGIGSTIAQHPNGIAVINTIRGGPSEKAGIKRWDIIEEINGQSVANWTTDAATQKLQGENGTTVDLTVRRVGITGLLHAKITRSEMPINSVSHNLMLNATTGFIVIKDFGETTVEEFRRAIRQLKAQGMKSLILDLRKNRGGLLCAAVGVCQQLFGPNELIVTQRGRDHKVAIESRTSKDCILDPFPIVVLIDPISASSAEIVAGSIQDHDRGLIVGQNSWGKGLVQAVSAIGKVRGLALTTSRYYTPSGRCIQKEYSHNIYDYKLSNNTNEEPIRHSGPSFKTDLGRTVYGNGGITPDYVVNSNKLNLSVTNLDNQYGAFYKFAIHEKVKYTMRPQQSINNATMERFRNWLKRQKIEYSEMDWNDQKNQVDIRNLITIEIQNIMYGEDAAFRFQSNHDPQVLKALDVMPKAKLLFKQKITAQTHSLMPNFQVDKQ